MSLERDGGRERVVKSEREREGRETKRERERRRERREGEWEYTQTNMKKAQKYINRQTTCRKISVQK